MSTTNSGRTENNFSIDDLVDAIAFLKHMNAPPKEIKLHPDDYEELKQLVDVHLSYPARGMPNSFDGVNIVIDSTAKRLPRK